MKYSPGLDGLRAIAILAVMLFHSNPDVLVGGYIGVDLFFVLSGFLIPSILVEEYRKSGSIDLRRFYLRRFLRLGPALLFMLAVYMMVAPLVWPGEPHGRDALLAGLYLSDFTVPSGLGPEHIGHSWSLAIEEQFYLLWPLLLVPILRSNRAILWLVIALIAMVAWRATFTDWRDYHYRLDTHGTGLVVGALLYFSAWRASKWVGLVGLVIFLSLCLFVEIEWSSFTILAAEIAAVMLIASVSETKWLEAPLLVHIGKLSYGLYLWHYPIADYFRTRFDFFTTATLVLLLSYGMALLSYHTIEALGRRMKSKISSHGSGKAAFPG